MHFQKANDIKSYNCIGKGYQCTFATSVENPACSRACTTSFFEETCHRKWISDNNCNKILNLISLNDGWAYALPLLLLYKGSISHSRHHSHSSVLNKNWHSGK